MTPTAGTNRAVARLLALAAVAACADPGADGAEAGSGARDTQPWIADTQYVVDSTGARLQIILGRPAGDVREVRPRAGSGDPDAPDAYRVLEPATIPSLMQAAGVPWYVLDVRTDVEYVTRGHLAGAKLVPVPLLAENVEDLHVRTDQIVLIYGADTRGGVEAARILAGFGFPHLRVVQGGFEAWSGGGLPVEGGA